MAHIERVQTGSKTIVYVRGRVYTSRGGQLKPVTESLGHRLQPQAKLRRRICLLSANAADNLERFGISEPCGGNACSHSHHARKDLEPLIISGTLRWVGGSENVAAWRIAQTLAVRPSQGVDTVQLVSL